MKFKFLVSCLALLLGLPMATHAASDFYINDGILLCPPQIPPNIDATNFVNNNFFSINYTNFFQNQPFRMASVLNFTNNGLMAGNLGFQFDTGPVGTGTRRMAANFKNAGTISSGSVGNTNSFAGLIFGLGLGLPKTVISATNVFLNSSTNIVGQDGLFSVTGKNVDLNRATVTMEGFFDSSTFFFNQAGIFDAYWGITSSSTNLSIMNPVFNFEFAPPITPVHFVLGPGVGVFGNFQQLVLPAANFYVNEFVDFTGTNRFVQAVFLSDTNSAVSNNVYFAGDIVVEWIGFSTNRSSGVVTTNYLYLFDDLLSRNSNSFFTNISYYSASPTLVPLNYTFFRGGPLASGTPAAPTTPSGVFDPVTVTNDYAAYGAVFLPTSLPTTGIPGGQITNLPGRIEISGDGILDLTRARITGLNYLRINAPNHFVGSDRGQISVPLSDITLASTNGNLNITNLLTPTVARFTGEVDLWSGHWTNDFGGFHSEYHVLFVDSRLSPIAPALVQDLALRSTNLSQNVVIADVLNVTRHLLIDAQRLTITTNRAPSPAGSGEINLISAQITWPGSTPHLQYFTNDGSFSSLNAVFFGGSRFSPYFTSNYNEPYLAFVNRGNVTTEGSLIWANYFENSGVFSSGPGFGSIALQSQTALLTNGFFLASGGYISITSGILTNINHVLQAGRKLTLNVTDVLTDGVTNGTTLATLTNANTWTVGKGVNLLAKPVTGDLLGTTIFETATSFAENTHLWAAEDRGCSPAGFNNNTALGRLILDGGDDSLFTFTGTGVSNALYVDYLEFRNFTTNIDFSGNFAGVQVDPNMTIYYAQAVVANGVSVAERLSGANGGRFCWVSNYAGIYSSTNLFYGGATNTVNAALMQSLNLDSDCDGLVNGNDPEPLFLVTTASLPEATNSGPYSVQLQAGGGPPSPRSWELMPGSFALPDGLVLSSDGLISGTPIETGGRFAFTVRANVETACGVLTADRSLSINVSPGVMALSVALVSQPTPGALVSWPGIPNSTNYVYFKPSPQASDWLLLTNFGVGSAAPARVSVFDPMAGNATRYYRVRVSTH